MHDFGRILRGLRQTAAESQHHFGRWLLALKSTTYGTAMKTRSEKYDCSRDESGGEFNFRKKSETDTGELGRREQWGWRTRGERRRRKGKISFARWGEDLGERKILAKSHRFCCVLVYSPNLRLSVTDRCIYVPCRSDCSDPCTPRINKFERTTASRNTKSILTLLLPKDEVRTNRR